MSLVLWETDQNENSLELKQQISANELRKINLIESIKFYCPLTDICSDFKHKLNFVQFLRRQDLTSSSCVSSTCVLIYGGLHTNTEEENLFFFFFAVHATFTAMTLGM